MTPSPIAATLTPKQAAEAMQLIEAGGKSLGAQSWGAALEVLTLLEVDFT